VHAWLFLSSVWHSALGYMVVLSRVFCPCPLIKSPIYSPWLLFFPAFDTKLTLLIYLEWNLMCTIFDIWVIGSLRDYFFEWGDTVFSEACVIKSKLWKFTHIELWRHNVLIKFWGVPPSLILFSNSSLCYKSFLIVMYDHDDCAIIIYSCNDSGQGPVLLNFYRQNLWILILR